MGREVAGGPGPGSCSGSVTSSLSYPFLSRIGRAERKTLPAPRLGLSKAGQGSRELGSSPDAVTCCDLLAASA